MTNHWQSVETYGFKIDLQVKTRFPKLTLLTCNIEDVKVEKRNVDLEKFKDEITKHIGEKYDFMTSDIFSESTCASLATLSNPPAKKFLPIKE